MEVTLEKQNGKSSAPAPFLTIHNAHAPQLGTPPIVDNADANIYVGYFANAYGEQWVFTFDRTTKEGTLRGGDANWEKVWPVVEGEVSSERLLLNEAESLWLLACWQAAVG